MEGGSLFSLSWIRNIFFSQNKKQILFLTTKNLLFFLQILPNILHWKLQGQIILIVSFRSTYFFSTKFGIFCWIYWKKNVPQIKTVFWISVWKNPQTNNVVDYTPMIVPTNMFLIGPVVSKKKTKMWPPRSVIFLLICIWGPGPL